MPTVLRSGPYRFSFYSLEPEGEPPHVHVKRDRLEAKVWLDDVTVARDHRFSEKEIGAILRIVDLNRTALLEAWHDFFATR